jgi:hypothetical protein
MLRLGERWMPVPVGSMGLDKSLLSGYFAKEKRDHRKGQSGYITPPLTAPRPKGGLAKRVGIVVLMVLMLLYLSGFSAPGYHDGHKKVVIILAANIGGGISYPVMLIIGVMGVKNGGDWAMEKWSIKNKRDYAARHGMSDHDPR